MPKQNFYDLAKEEAKKKVAEKVRAKKQVAEPYDAGKPDAYVVNGTLISRTRSGTTYIT
jgi:hypothetical protein